MKRFGVWTLVVLIAIMNVGYVRPGSAQSEDDELVVRISGASGQSVRTNVWLAAWDWTAPATGLVTFDTRGSDFDTLLSVFDNSSGTRVGANFDDDPVTPDHTEVRFTAQQGRLYGIYAVRDLEGGSIEPGTIVLNWQSSSPGGDNRASPDDFASATAISGASGRSEASSVGANKESGEPDHAGDDGGASVWWTWTAPTTGFVTFDTAAATSTRCWPSTPAAASAV